MGERSRTESGIMPSRIHARSERLAAEATWLVRHGPAHGRFWLLWSVGTHGQPALLARREQITGASRLIVVEPCEIERAGEGALGVPVYGPSEELTPPS